jgi:tRNA pseudouridine32 synthase/23S rRNA pseudouridine746 synthase
MTVGKALRRHLSRVTGFAMTPEEIQARLLYRDGLMLVLDKPAGLPVHRGPKGIEAFEDYFDALRFGLPRPPALAHRLDRDTTGCLVLGRHRKALALLGKLFKQGKVGKTYWAVVEGGPEADEGRIEIALSKRDESRGWWMKADPQGMPSATTWKVMGRYPSPAEGGSPRSGGVGVESSASADRTPLGAFGATDKSYTWLALEPLTGRTHQLRVHCAEMGFPIVGDTIYGTAPRVGGPSLHLHAREVIVPISKNKPPVVVTAALPAHMRALLTACGWKE